MYSFNNGSKLNPQSHFLNKLRITKMLDSLPQFMEVAKEKGVAIDL